MEQPFWIPMLAGAVARIWAATLVSPLELIRTKMQSQKLSYAGMFVYFYSFLLFTLNTTQTLQVSKLLHLEKTFL